MADTGPYLIDAIVRNSRLMALNNCPSVPVEMGRAFYGSVQNDTGPEKIPFGSGAQKKINEAIGFSGSNAETAVWHFSLDQPVHHFVVVPWYKHDFPHGRVYSVFMAYENKYTLGEYVKGTGGVVPAGGDGHKPFWTAEQLSTMLSDLINSGTAWQDYFGRVGPARAMKMTYCKYKTVLLKTAISNVKRY